MSAAPDWNTPRASMTRELGPSGRRRVLWWIASVLGLTLVAFAGGVVLSVQQPLSWPVRLVQAVASYFA